MPSCDYFSAREGVHTDSESESLPEVASCCSRGTSQNVEVKSESGARPNRRRSGAQSLVRRGELGSGDHGLVTRDTRVGRLLQCCSRKATGGVWRPFVLLQAG